MSDEQIDDGGSSFPAMLPGGNYCTPGMSLRDWFAGQVLAGNWEGRFPSDMMEPAIKRVARACYDIADAMLAERERRNEIQP